MATKKAKNPLEEKLKEFGLDSAGVKKVEELGVSSLDDLPDAFSDELLWRDLLRSVHATGQDDLVRAVVDELSARVALNEVLPQMAPETEALIDEICPSWRSAVS